MLLHPIAQSLPLVCTRAASSPCCLGPLRSLLLHRHRAQHLIISLLGKLLVIGKREFVAFLQWFSKDSPSTDRVLVVEDRAQPGLQLPSWSSGASGRRTQEQHDAETPAPKTIGITFQGGPVAHAELTKELSKLVEFNNS